MPTKLKPLTYKELIGTKVHVQDPKFTLNYFCRIMRARLFPAATYYPYVFLYELGVTYVETDASDFFKRHENTEVFMHSDGQLYSVPEEGVKPNAQQSIIEECDGIKELLLSKNAKYGNSALEPVRMFSKANTTEQIKVRIDDKLSRIKSSGSNLEDEDVVLDLIGYLILLRIASKP